MVRKKLIYILIVLFSFSLIGQVSITPVSATVELISVEEAHEMITNSTLYPDLLILDVRTQGEYDEEHICNATLIPVDELESRLSELYPYNDTKIIVYCQTGSRSAYASQILDSNGFMKVFDMSGGITAWKSAGYPVCPEKSEQGQSSIDFSFTIFIIFLFGTTGIILLYYKKHKFLKKN
ncbi:MAG: rhodanese-like domain-containing protein [Candidatus Thorarchaeota archaeon]